jgi:DnaJ-class molecular chaperone
MTHPLGESYEIWCELNPCLTCGGAGTVEDAGGGERSCLTCDGSGIDPSAVYDGGVDE